MKEISDLILTTYLSAIGYKFQSIKSNGKRLTFVFEDSETPERDILRFYNREARIDPLTFAEIFRNLKALTLRG